MIVLLTSIRSHDYYFSYVRPEMFFDFMQSFLPSSLDIPYPQPNMFYRISPGYYRYWTTDGEEPTSRSRSTSPHRGDRPKPAPCNTTSTTSSPPDGLRALRRPGSCSASTTPTHSGSKDSGP